MIIDIEGTDGCGKKTQTDLLFKYLTDNNWYSLSYGQIEDETPEAYGLTKGVEANTKLVATGGYYIFKVDITAPSVTVIKK